MAVCADLRQAAMGTLHPTEIRIWQKLMIFIQMQPTMSISGIR